VNTTVSVEIVFHLHWYEKMVGLSG